MATHTSRYNLSKPENTDEMQSFMSDYADNMDKIDENLGGGGGSANIVELTQAEYDALPDTKLTDNTMYLLKDANSASDAEFTHVYGLYLDTNNVIYSAFTFDDTEHSWTATSDCILTDNMWAPSNASAAFIRLDGKQVFATYDLDNPFVYVKKGQVVSYRAKNTSIMKAYGVQAGSEVTFLSEYASACYSTQEREVGCWVDGKPLYQKTIDIAPLPYNVTKEVAIGADVEKVISVKGYAYNPNSNYAIFFNDVVPADHSGDVRVYANTSTDKVYITTVSNLSIYTEAYVTILYTKTADVAGSGQWIPMAQPAHHYSTEEQVIGTWIDGKPLYEQVLPMTQAFSCTANTWAETEFAKGTKKALYKVVIVNDAGAVIDSLSGGFVNNNVALNSPRAFSINANTASLILQYTKSTD